jgi:hypothetical protein
MPESRDRAESIGEQLTTRPTEVQVPIGPGSPDPCAAIADLPGVFEAGEAARGATDALLRELQKPGLRGRVTEVSTEALRRSAWASATLELHETTGSRDGAIGWPDFVPPFPTGAAGAAAAGALRVSAELLRIAPVWRTAPAQAIARLNALAAADQAGDDMLGRPREAAAVGARLTALVELVTNPTAAPATVVAAVVLGELLAVRAFERGNGLVARGALRLVLIDRGLDPVAATVPEQGLLELDGSAGALEAYRSGSRPGVGHWVVHVAQAVALGARAGRMIAAEVASNERRLPEEAPLRPPDR